MEHSCSVEFHIKIPAVKDHGFPVLFPNHQLSVHAEVHDLYLNAFLSHAQKLRRPPKQLLPGQTGMALHGSLLQHIQKPAADPVVRIRVDTDLLRDLIRRLKAHAGNIICQTVGILLHDLVGSLSVFLVDFHRQRHGDPVSGQKHHGLAKLFFLFHLLRDLPRLPLADPLDLRQTFRLFLDDPEGVSPEPADDPGCQRRAHSLNRPAPQIPLHGRLILRREDCTLLHLHLFSVYRMLRHAPPDFQKFSLSEHRKYPHTGQFFLLRCQLKDRISVVRIPEYNMLHVSFAYLHPPPPVPLPGL